MNKKQLVWDLPLRLFHWCFALSIVLLWLTGELGVDYREYHFYLGYFVIFLLVFRISWGVIGTRYAKFVEFFPTPKRLCRYLNFPRKSAIDDKDALSSHETPVYVGHNPLGAMMVFLMLVLVGAQAGSGLFLSDDIIYDAPYFGVLSEPLQSIANSIHHYTFNFILLSIGLHISAIIYHEKVKKHDLVLPMITGNKVLQQKDAGIPHSSIIKAFIIAGLSAGFVYWLVVLNAPIIDDYFY